MAFFRRMPGLKARTFRVDEGGDENVAVDDDLLR